MASSDPSTLSSSSQIFSTNHTLPQIRAIHKSLHAQIDEKATRLRTQVGSSYRELLGTAETIVQMRGDNDEVQELLGTMGGRCGKSFVSAKAAGLEKFVTRERKLDATAAAKLALLDGCALVIDRILKGGGGIKEDVKRGDRLVLATKVLVLSRLLISSLGEESNESVRQALEAAKKTREHLRRRHRLNVEKVLKQVDENTDREDVLKALCAYSLAASSGARDVLRQFLQIRAGAMAMALDIDEGQRTTTADDIIHGMKLYTTTLLDVQALVPAKLSQSLLGLKKDRLLADYALKKLEGLRLDVYERWCGEEIQYFTPFIRHDDLDGKQAREKLFDWAKKGGQVLIQGLEKTLERMADFKSIMELRTSVLQLWIREGSKARGFDPSEMQDELRETINSRMLAVLESKVTMVRLVGSEVKATLEGWQEGVSDKHTSLWDEDGYDTALSNGVAPFIQEVASRMYGRNDAVSKAIYCYNSWYQVIDDVKDVVEALRKQRWDNDFEEIEDEETIHARQQALSKDDPKLLQDRLDTTIDKSFKALEEQLKQLWEGVSDERRSPAVAMYIIRVLREIRSELPDRPDIKHFGLGIVPALQKKITTHVSTSPLEVFVTTGLSQRTVGGRVLWEGEPPLPNTASPHLFMFLQSLSLSMADAGLDLWSPVAVVTMKRHLSERLCEVWGKELAAVLANISGGGSTVQKDIDKKKKKGKKNKKNKRKDENEAEDEKEAEGEDDAEDGDEGGDKKGDEDEEEKEPKPALFTTEQAGELCTQWLFDVSLLQCCIGNSTELPAEGLEDLKRDMYKHSGLDSEDSRQQITKSAQEFWQQISLLFGLLA